MIARFRVGFVLIASLFMFSLFLVFPEGVEAATLYWVGNEGANASVAANWSTSNPTSCSTGVTPSGSPPASGDTINFDADCDNGSSWDSSAASQVTILNLNSGYTGTVTLGRSLATSSTFTQASGTFSSGSNDTSWGSTFTLSGGIYTASSNIATMSGAITVSGSPTFNHNSGRVSLAGGAVTLACNNISFNLVTFNNTGTKTVNSDCSLPLGGGPAIPTSVTLAGTLSGSGRLTVLAGTLTLNAGASLSGFDALSVSAITVSGATTNLSSLTSFTASGAATLSSGSLTLPNGADFNSSLTISNGTFTAPSGTMTLAGALTISGSPTFNANSGTVIFDGGAVTLSCNNVTFNLVIFNHSGGAKTVSSNCSLPLGGGPAIPTSVTLAGTLSGTGRLTVLAGTLTLNAGATLSGFDALSVTAITVSGGTMDLSSLTSFTASGAATLSSGSLSLPSGADLNSTLTISNGTFTAPSGNMTLASSLTISGSPTFNANGGTIILDGSTGTWSCNNVSFNLIVFSHSGGAKTINSDCNLPLGGGPAIPTSLTLAGTLSGTGRLTFLAGTLTLNAGAAFSGFDALSVSVMTVSGGTMNLSSLNSFTASGAATLSSGSLSLPSGADLNSTLIISNGTFNAPSGDMTVASTFTVSGSPTFNANGGTITFDGGSATLTCNSVTFNRVIFNNTAVKTVASSCSLPLGASPTIANAITLNGTLTGSGTMTTTTGTFTMNAGSNITGFSSLAFGGALTNAGATVDFSSLTSISVASTFTISSGTFIAPSGTLSLAGNFTRSGGTFTHSSGEVVLNGTSQTISGELTFFDLTKTSQSNDILTFPSGAISTVSGTLALQGTSGSNILSLQASTRNVQWYFDPQGTRDILYLNVEDSNNINVNPVETAGLFVGDNGNNTNWIFESNPINASGTGYVHDMLNSQNWNIRIDGPEASGFAGWSIDSADLDGDGNKDLIVTAFRAGNNGLANSGSVYVIFHSLYSQLVGQGNTIDLADSSKWNIRFDGAAASAFLGSVARVGDVNNDGAVDLLLGSSGTGYNSKTSSGSLYILLNELFSNYTGTGNTVSMADTNNWNLRLDGRNASSALGNGEVVVDDLNKDNLNDLLFTAYNITSNQDSFFILYSSLVTANINGTGNTLNLATGSSFNIGYNAGCSNMNELLVADLVENGGKAIVAAGANAECGGGVSSAVGEVYVVYPSLYGSYSGTGNIVDLSNSANYNFRFFGGARLDFLGSAIVSGDFDQDGHADLAMSAASADPDGKNDAGSVYILLSSFLDNYLGTGNNLNMGSSLNYNFRIDGVAGSVFGYTMSATDYNEGGAPGLLIAAASGGFNSRAGSGSVYFLSNEILDNFSESGESLDVTNSSNFTVRYDGAYTGSSFGSLPSSMRDINGDGSHDLMTPAYSEDNNSRNSSGSVYIIYNFPHTFSLDEYDLAAGQTMTVTGNINLSDSSVTSLTNVQASVNSNSPSLSTWVNCSPTNGGSFNDSSTAFLCNLNISSLTAGNSYQVYVRAMDSNGFFTAPSHYGTFAFYKDYIPGINPNCPQYFKFCVQAGPNLVGGNTIITGGSGTLGHLATVIVDKTTNLIDLYITITEVPIETWNLFKIINGYFYLPLPWQHGKNTVSGIFNVQAVSSFNGYPVNKSDKPFVIQLSYDPKLLGKTSPKNISISYFDKASSTWKNLTTPLVVDEVNNTISATTKVFGLYTLTVPRTGSAKVTKSAVQKKKIAKKKVESVKKDSMEAKKKTCLLWFCF